jgi:hypothetical protein
MSRPHPQAVVAIDGQYVEFVEEIRPTGKKTVISQRHSLRRSKEGLWHGNLNSGQRRSESTSVWCEGRKLRGGEGGGQGEKGGGEG